jgi:hypothetical protein
MRGIKTITLNALALGLAGAALLQGANPDYFPLQVGNSWVYRTTDNRTPAAGTVEVLGTESVGSVAYYQVNFFGRLILLRMAADGTLYTYNTETKQEQVIVAFGGAEKQEFATGIDPCNSKASIESKSTPYDGRAGSFANALTLTFTPSCADAGITHETYVPSVGLIEHTTTTIAGPRKYELVYARAGATQVSDKEVAFGLTLDANTYVLNQLQPIRAMVRLTLRNTSNTPLNLVFPTGQDYDIVIRNIAGDEVYRWSNGLAFTQVVRNVSVLGEKNYAVSIPLDTLPAGKYTIDGYLTTSPRVYDATTTIEILPAQ